VGRARGLVVLGFLLLPLLFFSSAVRIDIFGEYSERIVRPADIAEIEESYELSGGRLVLDLRDLETGDFAVDAEPVAIEASVGMGELEVLMPLGVAVEAAAEVGMGRLEIRRFGEPAVERGGFGLEEFAPSDVTPPDVVLDLEVGAGNLELELR
jgi:hypothetical protein